MLTNSPETGIPDNVLVHLCAAADWSAASQHDHDYVPASLHDVGFVHLSTPEQVHLPANRLFAGRADLVVLNLNPHLFTAELRWEPGVPGDPDGMVFPHLFGPIPLEAVIGVEPYRPGPDGTFAPLAR